MRRANFRGILPAGFAALVLFVVPSAKSSPVDPTTVTLDLGTVGIGVNVNASILNLMQSSQLETYTYQQLLFGPDSSTVGMMLDSGLTVGEVLAQDLGPSNNGTLTYNFPFISGASGTYAQNGSPPFSSTNIGPGILQSLTATSVSGNVCTGFNNVGATISVDPTNPASTFATILGCDGITGLDPGFPTSTTTTVTLTLGSITANNTVTVIEGEDTTTTWQSSGQVGGVSAVPEPSSFWFDLAAIACVCLVGVRKRFLKAQ